MERIRGGGWRDEMRGLDSNCSTFNSAFSLWQSWVSSFGTASGVSATLSGAG